YRFDRNDGQFRLIARVDAQHPNNTLNDGGIDAAGRLGFGTMDNEERDTRGSLDRYSGGSPAQMHDGYVITNGPAMSPDGRTLYHVDTVNRQLLAFDVDGSGALAGKRLFAQIERPGTYPDGPTVDCEGNVWIGLFGGWGVDCYSPQGRLLHTLPLPVA